MLTRGSGGEKSIEIRMEEVQPIDPTLGFVEQTHENVAGLVTITLDKATRAQLEKLKRVLEDHPGEYEVSLQFLPKTENLLMHLPYTVDPLNGFKKKIQEVVWNAKVEVLGVRGAMVVEESEAFA